jgi:hypothetical protein
LIGPPTGAPFLPGEEVIIEVAVEKEGYWSQAAAVLFPSAPTPMQIHTNLTYGAYQDAVTAMKCGIAALKLHKGRSMVSRKRIEDFIEQDFGHGNWAGSSRTSQAGNSGQHPSFTG